MDVEPPYFSCSSRDIRIVSFRVLGSSHCSGSRKQAQEERKLSDIVHLILKRKHWNQIANGLKIHEYRDNTEYWRKRIIGKRIVIFHMGYSKETMIFLIKQIDLNDEQITITLGARITHANDS